MLIQCLVRELVITTVAASWAAFQRQLKARVQGRCECPVSRVGPCLTMCWKSRDPSETEITPSNFRSTSMGSVVHGAPCFFYACLKVPLASSLLSLFSFQSSESASSSFVPNSYFSLTLPFQFLQDPAFSASLPYRHLNVPLSPHTLCSAPQPFGQGALLSPRETRRRECVVSLVNVSTTSSLRQRGKSIKEMENTFLFLFYSNLF